MTSIMTHLQDSLYMYTYIQSKQVGGGGVYQVTKQQQHEGISSLPIMVSKVTFQ